ncbi:non-ribosomal peptide synthetase [Paludibacterium paludis]|uniref:Non-ribosomal peptide synthetase n=1 Tax=Paludibacterium paludis TaxID=1225769 RepID=A0A918P2W3_9NEIS|nr:non-ribosomal peptide synthetase [Paludibacterium paludis]GGY14801.1 non-ribosomal peptide synthetase [Paludibacterium paludis]
MLSELSRIAERFTDRIAIESDDVRISYRTLLQHVEDLARAVSAVCGPGERVATLLPQHIALAASALGIMGAGKVFAPLDPQLPPERLKALLGRIDAGLVVTERRWLGALSEALGERLADARVLLLDGDDGMPREAPPFAAWSLDEALAMPDAGGERTSPHAYLYFTSGSTGMPKAVLGRTDSLLHFIRWESRALRVGPEDRVSLLTAQMFDPFLRDLLLPLLNGATLCVPPGRELVYSPADLLAWFEARRITLTHMIPSLFQVLIEERGAADSLRHLRVAALAGEMLKGSLVDDFYALGLEHARLFNLYGPTETTLAKFCHPVCEADRNRPIVAVGHPIDDTAAHLVDERDEAVGAGETGEILIATPYMSAGYLDADQDAQARFIVRGGVPMYRTGDLGRRLPDGAIEVIGRKDFQFKVDGQRIEPGEIENALERHPDVLQAIVHPTATGTGRTVLVAYLRLRPGSTLACAEVWRAFLAPYLVVGAIPARFEAVEAFPLLPNGKIDRKALKPEPDERERARAEPSTDTERQLAVIWQSLLPVARIGLGESFFDLGGTSLMAIRMLARVRETTGAKVPFAGFLAEPTLDGLARAADRSPRADSRLVATGLRKGPPTLDQQRIAFHQRLHPDSPVYTMAYTASWRGPVDPVALQAALDALLARHSALGARFVFEDGEAVAELSGDARLRVQWRMVESASEAEAFIAADAGRPFDLSRPPLMRVTMLSLGAEEQILYLAMHHIIGDAWSVSMLWNELLDLYASAQRGAVCAMAPEALTLLDVADWQRRRPAAPLEYWLRQLAGPLPVAQLPYDRPPSSAPAQRGARLPLRLPSGLSERLRHLARERGATLYMTLLAAYAAFLYRYTRQDDVLIGTPVANRAEPELIALAGFFVNILVMRVRVDPAAGFAALLEAVRGIALEAFGHQDVPFHRLVEALNPERAAGVSALFQTMFAYQETMPAARRAGDADVSALSQLDTGTAKYDLTLEMWEEDDSLAGQMEYSTERFDAGTIERMLANFTVFLGALAREPLAPLGRLALLSDAERALIDTWNATQAPFSDDVAVHRLIEWQADATPHGDAVLFEDRALTYSELDAMANRWAHRLMAAGVGPGVPVALSIRRSDRLVIGFLAILKAGGVYVPLDPDYPLERRRFMLEDSGAGLMLTETALAPMLADLPADALFIDGDDALNCPGSRPEHAVSAEDPAYIIYTSGSTGVPKGVVIRHRGVCNLAQAEIELLRMRNASRVLQFASFSFDSSIWEIVMTLCAGGALVMAPAKDLMPGPALLHTLRHYRVTHVTLPPSALAALPDDPLPDLEVLIVAGEACGTDLLRKWGKGRRFINSYGPTEATVSAANAELEHDAERVHIGRPLNNTRIRLLDDQGQSVPVGVAGELYIGGVGLAIGYHRREALTAERFVPDPCDASGQARLYRTGDLARWLPDGNIEYLGRIDQQVKVRGYRIELGEVETVLREAPGITDAVVMARADFLQGSALVAYVLQDDGVSADIPAIRELARQRLPEFMLPAVIVPMTAFPRLPNNKVNRNGFPLPDTGASSGASLEAPEGEIEEAIAREWSELLGCGAIDRNTSFFDLGGHSLLAARVEARLAARHGIELAVHEIFEHKTIARLARVARSKTADALPSVADGADAPLTHAQRRMWFLEQMNPGSSAYHIGVVKHALGTVDPDLLRRSLAVLFERHEALRIRLLTDGAEVRQRVSDEPVQCDIQPVPALDDWAWHSTVDAIARAQLHTPFQLDGGPLYRLRIAVSDNGRCALVWIVHHLVMDEASFSVLDDELPRIYEALAAGLEPALPPPAARFLGYAQWERATGREPEWRRQLDDWKTVFATPPVIATLPSDMVRDAVTARDARAGIESFELDASVTARVRDLARRMGTTPFTVVLAGYMALLQRYTSERDITVGVPVSVRPFPELEGTVGLFLNTLALRAGVDPDSSFQSLLETLGGTVSRAWANQAVPFERVVDAVDAGRDHDGQPLFRTMLAYSRKSVAPGGRALELVSSPVAASCAKFDVTVFVEEYDEVFRGTLEYRASLFRPESIRRLAGHFCRLIDGAVADPACPVGALPILSDEERGFLLDGFNATDAPLPGQCAHRLFEAQVRRRPEAIACVCEGRELGYGELNARANRLARYLRAAGIGTGQRVGIFLERGESLVVAILAVMKTGAAYLPMDSGLPGQRLAYLLEDSAASLLITGEALASRVPGQGPARLLIDAQAERFASFAAGDPEWPVALGDPAYVIYTSGSTGLPKGVVVPHLGLANYLAHAVAHYDHPDGAGNPMHSSIAFDATITSLFVPLLTGKTLFIVPEDDEIERLCDLWREKPALTLAKITPAHLEVLSKILPASAAGHTAALVVGGEALLATTLAFWREHAPSVRVINEYGPTETTVGCCVYELAAGDAADAGPVPIGKPIRNTRLYVLDETGRVLPPGAVGELYIGGAGVALGYLNRPELTAERFVPDPFSADEGARLYKTGDLVRFDASGQLVYLGRKDHQVKLRGYRIELGEVEAALAAHPAVREAAAQIDERGGRRQLVAYAVLDSEDTEGILDDLAQNLPAYMVPSILVPVPAMPLTTNGKVDREALARLRPEPLREAPAVARSDMEKQLAAIWREVLNRDDIGIHDNFFELGGDSILSLQIVFRARQAGLDMTPRTVFDHPSIARMASAAGRRLPERGDEPPARGDVVLTPIQRWFFRHNAANPHHYNQSYLFDLEPGARADALETAFARVLDHHEGLRTRFERTGSVWRARVAEAETPFRLERFEVPRGDDAALREVLDSLERGLDIGRGRVFRGAYLEDGATARLAVVAHHLVVDGVSWRILLEDLIRAYDAIAAGREPALPARTASFQRWASYLAGLDAQREASFWLACLARPVARLPRGTGHPDARNDVASAQKIRMAFDPDFTEAFLVRAPQAYRANPADLALAALALALREWMPEGALRVDLEGHGRDGFDEAPDVSRTVGWFTTLYPLLLQIGTDGDADEAIRAVKEGVRSLPSRGAGFGWLAESDSAPNGICWGEVCFNYLGRFDADFHRSPLAGVSTPVSVQRQDPRNLRAYLLEVDAYVYGDALEVVWTYGGNVLAADRIHALTERFAHHLRAVVAHCLTLPAPRLTPSDFPMAGLAQDALDRLARRYPDLTDVYPLTATQEGMVFHTLNEPESGLYLEQLCFELETGTDPARLERAWRAVAGRHPVLRTRFDMAAAGHPLQIVTGSVDLSWRERVLPSGGMASVLQEDKARGFDLAEPLYRITLVHLPDGECIQLFSHHHAILDGWSVALLMDEVTHAYRGGEFTGEPRPYRDFLRWQQGRHEADRRYWQSRLAGLDEATPLPAGRRDPDGEDAIGRAEFAVPAAARDSIDAFVRLHQLTLSTLVQGAWALLLSRYTQVSDCLFGVTVSGRAHALHGLDAMLGLFIATIPARIAVDEEACVAEWLRWVQDAHLDAELHTSLSLADIKPHTRGGGHGALFETVVVFENYPASRTDEAPLFRFAGASERTNFPLTVVVSDRGGLHGHLHFDRRHYDEDTARRLAGHLARLIVALAGCADARLADVPMLSPEETRVLLTQWTGPAEPYPSGGAHALFEARARATPEAPALVHDGGIVRYRELDERAGRLAAALDARGVGKGSIVAVYLPRSVELVTSMLAVMKAGAAYLPIDAAYPAERVAYMAADSGAALVITGEQMAGRLPVPADRCFLIDREAYGPDRFAPLSAETASGDPVYVIYTSGSTGQPKGVLIEHGGLVNYLNYARRAYGAGPDTRAFLHSSVSFDATITSLWVPLVAGGRVLIVPDGEDATILSERLAAEPAGHLLKITPVHLEVLGQRLEPGAAGHVTSMVVGGEALKGAALAPWQDAAPGMRIFNEYGPTETVVGCCVHEFGADERYPGNVPIGRPIDNTRLYLLDARGRPVPLGAAGELYIGGAGVARGYLNRPELTAERFVPDPFADAGARLYRTGDLVRALPDGSLDYVGRRDQQIKLRGYRIEPGEIEAQLAAHPAVRQAAVVLRRDDGAGDGYLAAYVVPAGETPEPRALRDYLRARLPAHMVPSFFTVLPGLPETANGKVDYKALPVPAAMSATAAGREPEGDVEIALCAIWREVLGVEHAGVEDNFFELGGHSLKALRLMARIEQQWGVRVTVRDVFDAPSIAALAVIVEARMSGAKTAATAAITRLARKARQAESSQTE